MKATPTITRIVTQSITLPAALTFIILAAGCTTTQYGRSAGQSLDDRAITERVEVVLEKDTIYKFPEVKVATFKNEVQLSGFVQIDPQKSRAEQLAKNVAGVRTVYNNITVVRKGDDNHNEEDNRSENETADRQK